MKIGETYHERLIFSLSTNLTPVHVEGNWGLITASQFQVAIDARYTSMCRLKSDASIRNVALRWAGRWADLRSGESSACVRNVRSVTHDVLMKSLKFAKWILQHINNTMYNVSANNDRD